MALKNLFDMVKADRYTVDGREELIKAQKAETEDKVYQIGEISQKTGLQKTANGWVKPKNGKQPGAKKPDESARIAASKEAREKKSQELGQKAAGDFAKYKDLPPVQRKDALGAASHEGISIGMTQRSMEGMGWDLIQADDKVNVYGKPDGSKAIMKHDGKKITEVSYEAPGSKPATEKTDGFDYRSSMEKDPRSAASFKGAVSHSIPMNQTDRDELEGLSKFMSEEKATYQNALKNRAQALVDGHKGNGDWFPEKEKAIMKIAKAVGFDKELHKFIEEENRGYDLGYSEDSAPSLSEIVDRVYNIGEISEKTGLQKTAQGWRPPQETKFGKVKQNKEGQWGVQVKQGKGSDFLKHKSEAEAKRALSNYTAGYNTTARSKEDPHSDKARQVKQWRKEDEKAAKARRAEGRAEHAAQFENSVKPGAVINNAKDQSKEYLNKSVDYMKAYREEKDPDRQDVLASLVQNTRQQKEMYQAIDDMNRGTGGWAINKQTSKKLVELQKEQKDLEKKLRKSEPQPDRDNSPERAEYERQLAASQKQRAEDDPRGYGYEEPPMEPAAPRREAVSAGRMMKDLDGNFWSRPEDFKEDITSRGWDVDEMTNEYAVISNEAGSQYEVRFDDHSDDGDLTVRNFKALQIDEDDDDDSLEDAAPRVLTGDCRIRIRKEKPALTGDTKIRVRK